MTALPECRPSTMVPGAVIVSGGVRYLIWRRISNFDVVGLPIAPPSQARNEIPLDSDHLERMGLPRGHWVVRVSAPRQIRPAVKIGEAPGAVWAFVRTTVRREQAARKVEGAPKEGLRKDREGSVNLWRD